MPFKDESDEVEDRLDNEAEGDGERQVRLLFNI